MWKDPDTGREFEEISKSVLMDRIAAYRSQNNLEEIEGLSVVLENYWCGLAENQGRCVPARLERGFMGYLQGGIALLKNVMYGKVVRQEEADRRAGICVKCPYNVFPDKGPFMKWSDDAALAMVGDRRSKFHDRLGNCGVCSCVMKAKVFYSGTVDLEKDWIEPMQAVSCWQLSLDPSLQEKIKEPETNDYSNT